MNARKQAADAGQSKYTTGKPCEKRGHISERYTSNGMCVQCTKENNRSITSSFTTNRGRRHVLAHLGMVEALIHVPSKYTTILKTLENLMAAPNGDQFVSWVMIMDTAPLHRAELVAIFDYKEGVTHVNHTTVPWRADDLGLLEFNIRDNWYRASEIKEVFDGVRSHVERIPVPL